MVHNKNSKMATGWDFGLMVDNWYFAIMTGRKNEYCLLGPRSTITSTVTTINVSYYLLSFTFIYHH